MMTMKTFYGWILSACILTLCSCQNQATYDQTLLMLQHGKARGHLVVTTDGQLGGSITTSVAGGANRASLSFDGDIDFADSVRHVGDDE